MGEGNFDWRIWLKKIGLTTLAVVIAGGIAVWQDNAVWLAILPILQAIENYIKHR
jgi:hypothetical protein